MAPAKPKVIEVSTEELLARRKWLREQQEIRASLGDYDLQRELEEIAFLLGD